MEPWKGANKVVCSLSAVVLCVRLLLLLDSFNYVDTDLNPTDRFHVHIVNANMNGLLGMTVGQAHLLDDIIALVGILLR